MAQYQRPKIGWRDVLVTMGLGQPLARAFVAGVAGVTVLYAAGYPREAFDEDGNIRPFAPLTPLADGVTSKHFLVLPLTIAAAAYILT